jgi:hypothetical protein
VLPGGQSALIAQQAFHAAHHAAVHAVVQLTTTGSRNAAVLELADRYLGEIREAVGVALGLQTAARRVLISAQCQRHVIERRKITGRQITAQADADLLVELQAGALPANFSSSGPAKNARRSTRR